MIVFSKFYRIIVCSLLFYPVEEISIELNVTDASIKALGFISQCMDENDAFTDENWSFDFPALFFFQNNLFLKHEGTYVD